MTPTNLTSYVSVDPVHGVIVSFQIDDISGQIDFFFSNGVAKNQHQRIKSIAV